MVCAPISTFASSVKWWEKDKKTKSDMSYYVKWIYQVKLTGGEIIPVYHLVLYLITSSSATTRNGSITQSISRSNETGKIISPCNITVRFIWTTPLEVILERIALETGRWCKGGKEGLGGVCLTCGREKDSKLENISRRNFDASLVVRVPGVLNPFKGE
jgi:hypothetical protein